MDAVDLQKTRLGTIHDMFSKTFTENRESKCHLLELFWSIIFSNVGPKAEDLRPMATSTAVVI